LYFWFNKWRKTGKGGAGKSQGERSQGERGIFSKKCYEEKGVPHQNGCSEEKGVLQKQNT